MTIVYRLLTTLAAPFIALYLVLRKRKGREDKTRFAERLGFTSLPRPKGLLVWVHAASVGEALSILSLIDKIRQRHPAWSVLVTTGTVTSANLMQIRLPEGVLHQYVPVDRWPYVTRFLDHWKPDLTLWIESELWPNMLTALAQRRVPVVLLNGRMSERSYRRWRMIAGGAKKLMQTFALGLAQTGAERARFESLGLRDVRAIGNLKYAAAPLPFDETEMTKLGRMIDGRKVWIVASTHPGEEEIALATHRKLALRHPDLLTILVPRHPVRGPEIAALVASYNLKCTRRSLGEGIDPDTQVYLVDTMGEMGLFYRLAPLCCLAGSFTWGGHNPVEPALLGCCVVFGPRMDNFAIMADDMLGAGAALQVIDEAELEQKISALLDDNDLVAKQGEKALAWATSKAGVLEETLKCLDPFFRQAPS